MAVEKIKEVLKETDLLTHKRCLGIIEEHYFNGFDGQWICGKATAETIKNGGSDTDDISIHNITHINRKPIDLILNYPLLCGDCILNRICKRPDMICNAYGGLECINLRKD